MYTEPTGNEDHYEFGLSEVHSYLTNKLKSLRVVVEKYHNLEDNNPEDPMTGDPQHHLKYKMQLVSCLSQQFGRLNPQGMPYKFLFVLYMLLEVIIFRISM
jgi:hypothetical protein